MHVVDEEQERGELLATRNDTEFGRLLDRIVGIATGIGKTDDFRLGRLCLQQEGREIGGVKRVFDVAQYLAAIRSDDCGCITLQCGAEGVIGGQEKPAVAARLGQRLAGAVSEHVSIISIGDGIGVTGLTGEIRAGRSRIEEDCILVLHKVADCKRHARVRGIGDRIHVLGVDPLTRDVNADIGLVLVIAAQHLNLPAFRR